MNERLTAIVGAKISDFKRKMSSVKKTAATFANSDATKHVKANTQAFTAKMGLANTQVAAFTRNDAEKRITGDTSALVRSVAQAKAALAALPRKVIIDIQVSRKRFQRSMDAIADIYRDINTIGAEMFQGGLMMSLPIATTMMSGLIAVVATAGVQIGVMAGGLMGLASSLTLAGGGLGLMAAAAIPTIDRIKQANEAIANGDKKLSDYSAPMQSAITGLTGLKDAYHEVNRAIQPHFLQASGTAMGVLASALTTIKPGIEGVARAFQGLMTDLKKVMSNGEDVKKTMSWFNERAGQAVSAWGKIAGYALRGFLNLMRAFDPLAQSMEQGLLGMTKKFSQWAANLSKSDKFKTFIDYVKENGPKLMSVFGNITQGIVNLFTAFAPLAAEMMTGFQKLTARFKEWSASLGQNKQFQNFINYIKENGPGMIDLIGNLWDIFVQLAKGLGKVGEVMLPLANKFTSWFASLLEGNSTVRNMMGAAVALGGAFKLLAPIISGLWAVFGPAISKMWQAFLPFKKNLMIGFKMLGPKIAGFATKVGAMAMKVGGAFVKIIPKVVGFATKIGGVVIKVIGFLAKLGGRAAIFAARMAASWVIAMGPVGWVITIVAALVAAVIMNWDKIVAWTKKAWGIVSEWISTKWQQIWSKTKEIASKIVTAVREKFQQVKQGIQDKLQQAKETARNAIETMRTAISNKVEQIRTAVSNKFQQVKQAIQNKLQQAKQVAQNIWNSVKSFISNKVEQIRSSVSNKFQSLKEAIQSKLQSAKSTAQNIFNSIKSFLSNKAEQIRSSISNKFQQAKQAISDKLNQAKSKAQSIFNSIKSFISNKVEQIRNTVSQKFQALKQAISDKLQQAKDKAQSIFERIRSLVSDKVEQIRFTISEKFEQAKQAISDKINQAKTAAVNTVNRLKTSLVNTFERIRSAISDKIKSVKEAIKSGLEAALSFVKGMGSKFLSAGKGLITQMAKGITGAIGKVTGAVKGIAQKARNFLPFSPAKEGPLSDIDKLNFGGPIARSISKDAPKIQRSLGNMLALPKTGTPQLAGISTPRGSVGTMDHVVRDESSRTDSNDKYSRQPIIIQSVLNGREVARETYEDIDEMITRKKERRG
ncbi:hypothetical protein [Salimicrobium jeotgali]|uniref:hypothetical protein n=1 Tax=Salimicrobium jeotgali TaxID=1230341 RepID=UPI000C851E0C|nr:hypothetical protein [Salimicrobium jeotgali]